MSLTIYPLLFLYYPYPNDLEKKTLLSQLKYTSPTIVFHAKIISACLWKDVYNKRIFQMSTNYYFYKTGFFFFSYICVHCMEAIAGKVQRLAMSLPTSYPGIIWITINGKMYFLKNKTKLEMLWGKGQITSASTDKCHCLLTPYTYGDGVSHFL